MKQKFEYFRDLCIKRLSGEISDNENVELDKWINESPDNFEEYRKLEKIWISTEKSKDNLYTDLDIEWNKLESRISELENPSAQGSFLSRLSDIIFTPKLRPAFAIGTLAIITISLFLLLKSSPDNNLTTILTANNQILELELSDGSLVTLNSGSKISYFENFEEEQRKVELEGEAFFSVNKDGRPFIISTNNAVTTVLGTEFNVWARNKETRVLVREGKVSLADNNELTEKVILTEGETSKIIEDLPPTEPIKVDSKYLLGWLDRTLVFNNTPLNEIVDELERYYDIEVNIESNEFSSLRLTGSFEKESIETVLDKMCLALNLSFAKQSDGYVLTKKEL